MNPIIGMLAEVDNNFVTTVHKAARMLCSRESRRTTDNLRPTQK